MLGKTATTVAVQDGTWRVTYHQTVVAEWNDMFVTLRTGGYFTKTTKKRMNEASSQFGLGFSVYQKKGSWFVDYNDNTYKFENDTLTFKRE